MHNVSYRVMVSLR